MNNIVAIYSSPRKDGNTCTIGSAILNGAMGLSMNPIRVHRLNKLSHIRGCQFCHKCKGTGRCAVEDDISEILDDILWADVVIVMTPLFFGDVCGPYKVLQDRLYSFIGSNGRSILPPGKKFVFVISCDRDVEVAESVAEKINAIYSNLGFEIADTVVYCANGDMHAAAKDAAIISRAMEIGKKF